MSVLSLINTFSKNLFVQATLIRSVFDVASSNPMLCNVTIGNTMATISWNDGQCKPIAYLTSGGIIHGIRLIDIANLVICLFTLGRSLTTMIKNNRKAPLASATLKEVAKAKELIYRDYEVENLRNLGNFANTLKTINCVELKKVFCAAEIPITSVKKSYLNKQGLVDSIRDEIWRRSEVYVVSPELEKYKFVTSLTGSDVFDEARVELFQNLQTAWNEMTNNTKKVNDCLSIESLRTSHWKWLLECAKGTDI